jgi:hypothetical protein
MWTFTTTCKSVAARIVAENQEITDMNVRMILSLLMKNLIKRRDVGM